jgi:capsid assembly protease
VMHADLSGQLDQDGMRVTLVHSGNHKVDGNPYEPLPAEVRHDIQREIDVLRFLFTETVAAGRAGRLSQEAAMATEAATYRGADAIAAGLADEVTDLARGFAAFRQLVTRSPVLSPARTRRASLPHPRQEAHMATENDADDSPQDALNEATEPQGDNTDAADHPPAAPTTPQSATAPTAPAATQPGNLAELSAQLREAAAEIAEIAAQAGRLGVTIDAAKALREGTSPEALRRLVIERASAAADARDIVAAPPSPVRPQVKESPIVAAAKRAAAAGGRA